LRRRGRLEYDPEMLVVHPPRPARFGDLVRAMRRWESEFQLANKHPEAYRRSVHRSPWRVIYYHQFFVQAGLRLWRFRRLAWREPLAFLQLLTLLAAQRAYLIRLFPQFLRAARRYPRSPSPCSP
jgi:hypothetical protein